MDKKYKDLKNLPDDKKAEKALELANEMAQKLKENNGIDKDVDIVINFTDQDKNGELGAFVRQDDKKIEIYINPKEVDVSDMDQVYGALGYEMNHYNPSNPYVYDKKDKEVIKGTELHDREEQFTGIGRKPIEGSGNSFYEDILLGSKELDKGNSKYDKYTEDDLDFKEAIGGMNRTEEEINQTIYNKLKACGGKQKCENNVNNQIINKSKKVREYENNTINSINKGKNKGSSNGNNSKNKNKEKELREKITNGGSANILDHMDRLNNLNELYKTSPEFFQKVEELLPYARNLSEAQTMAFNGYGIEDAKRVQTNQGYISTATNFVPGYGQYKVIGEAILGKNLLTGQSLDVLERLASVNSLAGGFIKLGSLIPESTGTVKPLTNTKKEEVKTITTEDGNTYNVKVNTSNSNNTGSSSGSSNNSAYTGKLVKVNKADPAADELAKRIGGESRVKYSNDPAGREFDAISNEYIAQAKPALNTLNPAVRKQMKATFEAAKDTNKKVYYQFEGEPHKSVIDKLNEYSKRYGIEVKIDTKPLNK